MKFKILFLTLLLGNCAAYKINDLNMYRAAGAIQNNANAEKKSTSKKVIVSDVSISEISDVKPEDTKAMSLSFSSYIKSEMNREMKFIELIDRDSMQGLTKEVALYEYLSPESNLANKNAILKLADFAILTSVYDVEYSSRLENKVVQNIALNASIMAAAAKENMYAPPSTYVQPTYEHEMTLNGEIKIVKLPELEVVYSIPFKRSDSFSEDASISSQTILGSFNSAVSKSTNIANLLLRKIFKEELHKDIKKIERFFYPIEAYITDIKKNNKGELIVMIDKGSKAGIEKKFRVSSDSSVSDSTKSGLKVEKSFDIGRVSQYVMIDKSWIRIFDDKKTIDLKIGDILYIYE